MIFTLTFSLFCVNASGASDVNKLHSKVSVNESDKIFKADSPISQPIVKKDVRSEVDSDAAFPQIEGTYFSLYTYKEDLFGDALSIKLISSTETSAQYMISGLMRGWFGYPFDVPATFYPESEYHKGKPILVIAPGTPIYEYSDGTVCKLYLIKNADNGGHTYYPEGEIIYVYDRENNSFKIYNKNAFLGYVLEKVDGEIRGQSFNGQLTEFKGSNGKMTSSCYDEEQNDFLPSQYGLYAYQLEESLYVYGIGGSDCAIEFQIDKSSKTAVGINQVAAPDFAYDYAEDGSLLYTGDYTWMNVKTGVYQINATLQNIDGHGVLTITDDEIGAYSEKLDEYYENTRMKNVEMIFDFAIEGIPDTSGIESVVDESAQMPEFFNMQGIKIINPYPGQILIKKTGSKTSKVIY